MMRRNCDFRFTHNEKLTGHQEKAEEGIKIMLVCDYIVERIEGDYAMLKRIDEPEEELKCVARALLPEEIMEGNTLHYEMMTYTIVG